MSDKKNHNGIVLYEGPSQLDGEEIVVIATGMKSSSANRKTGNLIQTWIIRQDKKPTEAWKDTTHTSVCGDCKHGSSKGGSCYVNLVGTNGVWEAWRNNRYEKGFISTPEGPVLKREVANKFIGRATRFGAFGDPVAVPFTIWEPILDAVKDTAIWTGYTHSWTNPACTDDYKKFLMASVDNEQELEEARSQGWRTFRTLIPGEESVKGEFTCPASNEAMEKTGKKMTCVECGACNGVPDGNTRRGSVSIMLHGLQWKVDRAVNYRALTESAAFSGTEKPVELTIGGN